MLVYHTSSSDFHVHPLYPFPTPSARRVPARLLFACHRGRVRPGRDPHAPHAPTRSQLRAGAQHAVQPPPHHHGKGPALQRRRGRRIPRGGRTTQVRTERGWKGAGHAWRFGSTYLSTCLFLLSAEWRWTTCTRTSTQRDRAQTAPRRRDAPKRQAVSCAVSLPWVCRLLALTLPYFIPTVYTATVTLSECTVSQSARIKVFIRQITTQSDPSTAPVARPTVSAPVSQRSAGGGLKAAARHVG